MKRTLVALALASLVSTTASAGVVYNREVRQQQRVGQGIATEALNPREATRIERQEWALRHEVAEFREDDRGRLTRFERARIERQQNRLSNEIHHEKHDGRW